MQTVFWTNIIWYLLLGVISLAVFISALIKAKDKKFTLAFFLTVFGLTFWVEAVLLIYLKAYTYYPLILYSGPGNFDDSLAGNLFSQFSISAALLFSVVFDLKCYWYLIFAAAFAGIESLFIYLGIYSVTWYDPWITSALLPFLFLFTRWLYKKILRGVKPLFYYELVMLGLFPLNIAFLTWAFMLLKLQDMSYTLFPDAVMSRQTIVLIHFLVLSVPLIYIHFARIRIITKAAVITGLFLVYYAMLLLGLIWIKDGLFFVVSAFSIFWMYFLIWLIDTLYGKPMKRISL